MSAFLSNNKGFTLIEALIAIFVLTIGILGVAAMQTGSIKANSTANARSDANAVGLSFIEVLQQLPYDAAVLTDSDNNKNAGLNDSQGSADYGVVSADFQTGGVFERLAQSYSVTDDAANILIDARGREYNVFWNIADLSLAGGEGKVIRIFVQWNTPMGRNSFVSTALKYKNISL